MDLESPSDAMLPKLELSHDKRSVDCTAANDNPDAVGADGQIDASIINFYGTVW